MPGSVNRRAERTDKPNAPPTPFCDVQNFVVGATKFRPTGTIGVVRSPWQRVRRNTRLAQPYLTHAALPLSCLCWPNQLAAKDRADSITVLRQAIRYETNP